jgi:hypothetical protein
MNVTDSLNGIEGYVRSARRVLAPVLTELASRDQARDQGLERAYLLVADTLVILEDTINRCQRERAALDETGKLLRHKDCSQCGREFDFLDAPGREPIYCSAGCRQAAYRGRAAQRS